MRLFVMGASAIANTLKIGIKSEGSIVLRHSILYCAPTLCRKVCSVGQIVSKIDS